jgi:5,5'-dehydrodivanillate O-demethylase
MGPPETKPLLPRWDILVWKDVFQKIETRPVLHCNWLQPEENSADTTHLYYLHAHVFRVKGQPPRGDGRESGIRSFGFQPFKWGIIKSWIFEDKPGGPEWGKMVVFPNMLRLNNALHWRVPIDDVSTRIIRVDFRPLHQGEAPRAEDEEPPFSYEASWLNELGEYHMDTQSSQDGMAWETQGAIWDRSREHLGASDTGIVMLREMIMDAIATVHRGEDPMGVVRDPEENDCIDLMGWMRESSRQRYWSGPGRPEDEIFDDQHVVYEVPIGAGRPAASR